MTREMREVAAREGLAAAMRVFQEKRTSKRSAKIHRILLTYIFAGSRKHKRGKEVRNDTPDRCTI